MALKRVGAGSSKHSDIPFYGIMSVLVVLWVVVLVIERAMYINLEPINELASLTISSDFDTTAPFVDQPHKATRTIYPGAAVQMQRFLIKTGTLPPEPEYPVAGSRPKSEDCPVPQNVREKQTVPDSHTQVKAKVGHPEEGENRVVHVVMHPPVSVSHESSIAMHDRDFGVVDWPEGTVVGMRVTSTCQVSYSASTDTYTAGWKALSVSDPATFPTTLFSPPHVTIGGFRVNPDHLRKALAKGVPLTDPALFDLSLKAVEQRFKFSEGYHYAPGRDRPVDAAPPSAHKCEVGDIRVQHVAHALAFPFTVVAVNVGGTLKPYTAHGDIRGDGKGSELFFVEAGEVHLRDALDIEVAVVVRRAVTLRLALAFVTCIVLVFCGQGLLRGASLSCLSVGCAVAATDYHYWGITDPNAISALIAPQLVMLAFDAFLDYMCCSSLSKRTPPKDARYTS